MLPPASSVPPIFLQLLLAAGLRGASGFGKTSKTSAVVSYLPEWRFEGANWDTICEHSTHLLLFSLEPTPAGFITAQERLPRKELLTLARSAATRHGTELLICFGGNGRSAGFSQMVRKRKRRTRFVEELWKLMEKHQLDGVDYNWEYPGYDFRKGYLPEEEITLDYKGLSALIRETKAFFLAQGAAKTVTMAYYPDTRQERLIKKYGIDVHADLMHIMCYDQHGEHHSTNEYGRKCADQGVEVLPPEKLALGVPFYGRHSRTGDWVTYEDLVQKHHPLPPHKDSVPVPDARGVSYGFNGVLSIEEKMRYALRSGLAGVMIWEVGQDCRLQPVTHGGKTHVRTCPAENSSLLLAISRAAGELGWERARMEGWRPGGADATAAERAEL